ncbi:MAG: hypothetical protein WCI29_12805, partial [Actinomycetes bacterium]
MNRADVPISIASGAAARRLAPIETQKAGNDRRAVVPSLCKGIGGESEGHRSSTYRIAKFYLPPRVEVAGIEPASFVGDRGL